ncbi:sensor histidine kinase [Gordonia sp. NPDC062954]|uniref:sensor histidine kinase n=1 Tax=Gordonia sp. NPDC062954 TaxID=3364003 RepID=UPI0037C825F7
MRPEDYQPQLSVFSHVWRLALTLVISAVAWGSRIGYQWEHARWWFVADLCIGLAGYVAVWFRRRHPVAVATFENLATAISASAAGPATLAMVSLSTRRRWREIIPQVILALVSGAVAEDVLNVPDVTEPWLLRYGIMVAVVATMVAWGMYVGSRRELLASWRARAILAESERDAEVGRARSVERARIAREMHDVLAHRISTVSMYAGALAYRDDLGREQVRDTARTIEETSRLALTELREVLGVLREGPGDADPESPQARPADLDELIAENRRDGMRIEYLCRAELAGMSATRVRTIYRCVQEALTNARKHAPAATVTVRITGDPSAGVDLLVDNPLPLRPEATALPPSGLGLVGVAERVALSGGRHSAVRTDDRHFVLHVWLPWQS